MMKAKNTEQRTTVRGRLRPAGFWASAPLLVAGLLLTAGCSGDSSSAADGPDSGASPTSRQDKALAYSKCMRDNGVSGFPDPAEGGGGIRLTPESGVDMNSSEFRAAEEKCQELSPQSDAAGPGGKLDPAKVAAWSECVRENGVPDFADPEIKGGAMELTFEGTGIDPQSEEFQKAMDACRDKSPGGGILMKGGPQ